MTEKLKLKGVGGETLRIKSCILIWYILHTRETLVDVCASAACAFSAFGVHRFWVLLDGWPGRLLTLCRLSLDFDEDWS